jgi:hypothetical protein
MGTTDNQMEAGMGQQPHSASMPMMTNINLFPISLCNIYFGTSKYDLARFKI